MYNKVRLYLQGWSNVDHGDQHIETNIERDLIVKKIREGGRFCIFECGELVAEVVGDSVKLNTGRFEYIPSDNRVDKAWLTPEGNKIVLKASKRYFTVDDGEEIWIYKSGGILESIESILIDRKCRFRERFCEVYFSSDIAPAYVIATILVALFEDF